MEVAFCSDRFDTNWIHWTVEILERAFDATWSAVKDNDSPVDFDSDENLETILRRELIEIARSMA